MKRGGGEKLEICIKHNITAQGASRKEVQDKILKEMSKGKAKTGLHGLPMWFLWSRRIIKAFALTSMSFSDFPLL